MPELISPPDRCDNENHLQTLLNVLGAGWGGRGGGKIAPSSEPSKQRKAQTESAQSSRGLHEPAVLDLRGVRSQVCKMVRYSASTCTACTLASTSSTIISEGRVGALL